MSHSNAYESPSPGLPQASLPGVVPATVPTVKIVSTDTPQGFVIINESDFNPATMTLCEG